MASAEDWKARLNAASAAQARYLWILVVVGIFFLAIDAQISAVLPPPDVKVPFVDISLSTIVVWASGPTIIFFLILVLAGTHRVYKRAGEALRDGRTGSESADIFPNALDFVVYTSPGSYPRLQKVLRFAYQFVVSLFVVEGTYLMSRIWSYRVILQHSWLFLYLGAITGAVAWILLVESWVARWRLR